MHPDMMLGTLGELGWRSGMRGLFFGGGPGFDSQAGDQFMELVVTVNPKVPKREKSATA